MWTVSASFSSDRVIEPNQVIDVAVFEPIPYTLADSGMVFRSGLGVTKLFSNGVIIPRLDHFSKMVGLYLGNQCGDWVDIASPELLPFPFRFDRRSATPAENVRDDSYIDTLFFRVPQGLGGDESREFRRIAVNPMNRILSLIPIIPV